MISIKQARLFAQNLLKNNSQSPALDADILLAHQLQKRRIYLYTHPETLLTEEEWKNYEQNLHRCKKGFPVAYLIGQKEFWSLPLEITEDTLIPRPETELLVELCLSQLQHLKHVKILDLGTGSGAIALALASEHQDWQITACDKSKKALHIAYQNAMRLALSNVTFLESDWFLNIPNQTFHAIVSNPPYIADNDPHLQQGALPYEPKNALTSGPLGLNALKTIITHAQDFLMPDGFLLIEHGFEQKALVTTLLEQYAYSKIHTYQDYQGHDRATIAWKRG